uniref:Uncharacterized protein n=1 Tax=Euplotes crassus TaxID=5936 RepID=A0A7S3NYZ6_EUPCR|mmetsp:Transcript_34516/g.34167  ORF Transcript_34516/g.34167 Transcript_34516/m.34167 type:complete len:134 (+) Transcript_34516:143-544(+)
MVLQQMSQQKTIQRPSALTSIKSKERRIKDIFTNKFGNLEEEKIMTQHLQPTTNGEHITITYKLHIELDYGISSRKATCLEIPLYIQVPEPGLHHEVEAPADWNPTIISDADDLSLISGAEEPLLNSPPPSHV